MLGRVLTHRYGPITALVPTSAPSVKGAPVSRSSAPQVLERPGSAREVTRPATETLETLETPEALGTPESATPPRTRRARRLPHPPGRRAPLWFAALVAGAVLAAVPSLTGAGSEVITADASDYGLGVASDLGLTGMDEAGVRQGLTQAEAQARLNELAASRAAREPKTVRPVTEFRLTTCYCMRWGQMHYGLDMAAPLGTPIYAATDGVVIRAGRASGFGNAVYIQDADGNVHIYGHMRYYDVSAGDIVHAGDQIAKVGNEGYSTGPHLHYEIHRGGEDGRPIDPQEYLAERGVSI
ncbi:hypothetical protein GCM10010531_02330 [Blastococcus jejuensis]|uniref:M23ase beta-sheet core domain-containing protein n=1 Tax=Blastococcus jejuensis TaxID=351224 RepID=A0ABP6NPK6_9ACTN